MVRENIDFCRDWKLCLEDERQMVVPAYTPERSFDIHLPHTWNATDTFAPSRGYWRGVGWYRKDFQTLESWEDRRVVLELLGFFCTAHVWINETCIAHSVDGFTGGLFELSDALNPPGQMNTLAIRIDNRHDPELLPGKDVPDYVLYGGIYREAFLRVTEPAHIVERGVVFRTGNVSAASASCVVETEVEGLQPGASYRLQTELTDPNGNSVSTSVTEIAASGKIQQTFEVTAPVLWSVDAPARYTLAAKLERGDTSDTWKTIDSTEVRVGIRSFEFRVDGDFKLNGKTLFLKGVNRHQDFGGLGNAIPERLQAYDAEKIKELGGNFVRLSHYPQHPAFLDACDRLGILCFAEIASWQHIGGPRFAVNAEAMMRAMIRRDANHPSIVLWGLLNEGRSKSLFERLNDVAHECDSTRSTVYAENFPEEGTRLGTVDIPDVLGLNYKFPHLDEIRALWPDKKLFSSEHTNADMCVRGDAKEESSYIDNLQNNFEILAAHPFMAGATLWCFHDYATDYRPTWPHHFSGAVDHLRLDKEAAHLLRAWWREEPVVHIVGHWTYPGDEGCEKALRVLTNADRVELFLDDTSLGEKTGGQVLEWTLPYRAGRLVARAVRGAETCEAVLETAGQATELRLEALTGTIHADGRDAGLVDVRLLDAQGRLAPESRTVSLEIEGPGQLRTIGGLSVVNVAVGAGRFVVQSSGAEGNVRVRAAAVGVGEGCVEITAGA